MGLGGARHMDSAAVVVELSDQLRVSPAIATGRYTVQAITRSRGNSTAGDATSSTLSLMKSLGEVLQTARARADGAFAEMRDRLQMQHAPIMVPP
jgi:hypothetical protein